MTILQSFLIFSILFNIGCLCFDDIVESCQDSNANFVDNSLESDSKNSHSCCPGRNSIHDNNDNDDNNDKEDSISLHEKNNDQIDIATPQHTSHINHNQSFHQVLIPGGVFLMGSSRDKPPRHVASTAANFLADGEHPARPVRLSSFYIDKNPVSNAQFKEFVDSTHHKTDAEAYGWSFVFEMFLSETQLKKATQAVAGAKWWSKYLKRK
jgi:formylglycine-generating enzyme required for sulfatase activity